MHCLVEVHFSLPIKAAVTLLQLCIFLDQSTSIFERKNLAAPDIFLTLILLIIAKSRVCLYHTTFKAHVKVFHFFEDLRGNETFEILSFPVFIHRLIW